MPQAEGNYHPDTDLKPVLTIYVQHILWIYQPKNGSEHTSKRIHASQFQTQSGIASQRVAFLNFFSWKLVFENKMILSKLFTFTLEKVCTYVNSNPVRAGYLQVNQTLCRV